MGKQLSKQMRAPRSGPVTFAVSADMLWLEVGTDPRITTATAEVTGPPEVTSAVRESMSGSTWSLAWPRTGRSGGITIGGGNYGATVISGGSYQNIMMGGGRIVVNGVDVTSAVSAAQPEPLRAVVRLPVGSSIEVRITAGSVTANGPLAHVRAETTSADLEIATVGTIEARSISGDIEVGMAVGTARLSSTSGDITVGDARSPVNAHSISGDISVHATQAITVDANAVSGDVRVTSDPGVRPDVHGHSVSGRVRTR